MADTLWWEDFEVGRRFDLGSYEVTREEVIDFASRYDPQPYHIDDDAGAANPIFGRLSACGAHTFAMTVRMTFDGHRRHGIAPVAGLGTDMLRFEKPVYPGDILTGFNEVAEVRELRSRPDRGLVHLRTAATNQHGDQVISYTGLLFFARRPAAG